MKPTKILALGFALLASFSVVAEGVWDKLTTPSSDPRPITVYRSPSCNCCGIWVEHLKRHNFAVTEIQMDDVNPIKQQHGIPYDMASCHTALIGDYLIEGHVPASDINRLLEERPDIAGLSVPGMPHGTPWDGNERTKRPLLGDRV